MKLFKDFSKKELVNLQKGQIIMTNMLKLITYVMC